MSARGHSMPRRPVTLHTPVADRDVEMVERVEARAAPVAARGANPKDRLGAAKVSLTKLPAVACLHAAAAMGDGARKYGAFNWRTKPVLASIYVDACLRHLLAWFDREECAADSGVHHLGHAMACMAIILDAQECGALVDDRPEGAGGFVRVLAALNERGASRAKAPDATPVVDAAREWVDSGAGCSERLRDAVRVHDAGAAPAAPPEHATACAEQVLAAWRARVTG